MQHIFLFFFGVDTIKPGGIIHQFFRIHRNFRHIIDPEKCLRVFDYEHLM